MCQTRFPAHQKEYVRVSIPICKCDQKCEEIPNNFYLDVACVKRQDLVNKDDGLLGKGMRLAG
jgi:hypothetical protein